MTKLDKPTPYDAFLGKDVKVVFKEGDVTVRSLHGRLTSGAGKYLTVETTGRSYLIAQETILKIVMEGTGHGSNNKSD